MIRGFVLAVAFGLICAGGGYAFGHASADRSPTRTIDSAGAARFVVAQLPNQYADEALCPEGTPEIKGERFTCEIVDGSYVPKAEVEVASDLGLLRLVSIRGWPEECPAYLPCR